MTEDELLKARGKKPPKNSSSDRETTLQKILEQTALGKDDPFGENGTAIIVLRMAGLSVHQIVNKLQLDDTAGSGTAHVRAVLYEARRQAKLTDVGPLLDHMAVPMAVDNLIDGIAKGNEQYTLAVLKGRGAFRNFERTEGDNRMSLEITVEGLDQADKATVVEGSVIGVPRPQSASTRDADDEGRF